MTEDELADVQDHVLKTLSRPDDLETIVSLLQQSHSSNQWADYVSGFDPKMVEVAVQLTRQWGQRV
ncbi:MAG: hypothetical protein ACFCU8_10295 [Thermosynechococcaceae cyanobacterium]